MTAKAHNEDQINSILLDVKSSKPKSTADQQCAPGVKFEAGSCISLDVLERMADAWNKSARDPIPLSQNMSIINPKKYKIYLVHMLGERLKDKCSDQKCWLTLDFMKNIKPTDYFRPDSPQGKFEWLSTIDIRDSLKQYEKKYRDLKFFGAVPMDFADLDCYDDINSANYGALYKQGKTKLGYVFNLDESYKSGSHWVAMFADLAKGHIFYFDSFAQKPEKRVRSLMRKIVRYLTNERGMNLNENSGGSGTSASSGSGTSASSGSGASSNRSIIKEVKQDIAEKEKKFPKSANANQNLNRSASNGGSQHNMIRIDYNNIQHQQKNTECGVYSMNFLIRMARGDDFHTLCEKIVRDDKMNKCRKVYFDKHNKRQKVK